MIDLPGRWYDLPDADQDWSPLMVEPHPRVFVSRVEKPKRPPTLACGDPSGLAAEQRQATLAIPAWRGQWLWTIVSPADEWAMHWSWFVDANGYAVRNYARKQQYLHRLVCWCQKERRAEPAPNIWMSSSAVVDHGDRNRLNNRRSNLTMTTQTLNSLNVESDNPYPGVTWNEERQAWLARVKHHGKNIWLGTFPSAKQALRVVERENTRLARLRAQDAAATTKHATGELLAPVPF